MQVGDHSVHILVDGKELEEHCIEFETPTRMRCWIASEEGKTFSIKWQCHAETRTQGGKADITVDGIECAHPTMYPGGLGKGDIKVRQGMNTASKTHDFMFLRVQLDDDDRLLDKKVPNGFGEISVRIRHGTLDIVPLVCQHNRTVPEVECRFHEKSIKACDHRIGFGPEKPKAFLGTHVSHLTANDELPLFFIFKYSPLAVLQAHGIVPSPSPKLESQRLQSDDPLQAKSELQEIRETMNLLQKQLKRLGDLEVRLSEPNPKRIKREDSNTGKRLVFASDVIDLTVD
ncbi:hypothetical protein JVU11DRAFT_3960 [Chiua virens]|nr:hypothetical protein JVU11DRAFT_3960 [Chiua virens]